MQITSSNHADQRRRRRHSAVSASDPTKTQRLRRRIAAAGSVYVGSWLVGLAAAPATPAATAPAEVLQDHYADSGLQITLQSSLVHGVAGIALAVLALTIPAATSSSPALARMTKGFGVSAALVSLLQVVLAVAAVFTASSAAAETVAELIDAVNLADTAKLVLLSVFASAATAAASRAAVVGRGTRALTAVLAVALPIGGMGFIIDHIVLTAVLYASLPLLLSWAGVIAWRFGWRHTV